MLNRVTRNMKQWIGGSTRKSSMLKLIGLSAAAAFTIRLFYTSSSSSLSSESSFTPTLLAKQSDLLIKRTQAHDEKLVGVILLTRHGARTPLHVLSGLEQVEYKPELLETFVKANYKLKSLDNSDLDNDIMSLYDQRNYEKILKGGAARGQLTKVGENQMFNLGRRLKKRYVDELKFLPDQYDPEIFYTRSTHYKRTIHSAKSVLAGLFLDTNLVSNNNPFIINVHDLQEDCLFPNSLKCPYMADVFVEKLSLYTSNMEYVTNLQELNKVLKRAGDDLPDVSFTSFRDDMIARQVHQLPVPAHLKSLTEKSHRYANMELSAVLGHSIKLSCGQLLNLIGENILDSIENHKKGRNDFHKFRYYSVHDSTINALLLAFDLVTDENHSWPPFGADLIIELWEKKAKKEGKNEPKSEYLLNVLYLGEPVKLPDCESINCNYDTFRKILDKNSIDKHEFNRLCSQKFTVSS